MKTLRPIAYFCAVLLSLRVAAARAEIPGPASVPLSVALETHTLTLEAQGNGRDQLTFTLNNPTPSPIAVTVPAGLIAGGTAPADRVVVVRAATATVPARSAVELSLPVAALSSKNAVSPQSYRLLPGAAEPRLSALLTNLADQPDAPRPTVQLAVLGLLEDLNFTQWRQFLGTGGAAQPTPAEVTQAIDALGLLQAAAPQQLTALGNDTELKLRALRNPWARAKAVALYGLDAGGDAVPPDLRQLLHTAPGDNCPICRQRALMQKQGDIP